MTFRILILLVALSTAALAQTKTLHVDIDTSGQTKGRMTPSCQEMKSLLSKAKDDLAEKERMQLKWEEMLKNHEIYQDSFDAAASRLVSARKKVLELTSNVNDCSVEMEKDQVQSLSFTLTSDTSVLVTATLNPPSKEPEGLRKYEYWIRDVTIEGGLRERPAPMPGWPSRSEKETERLTNMAPSKLLFYGAFSGSITVAKLQEILKTDSLTVRLNIGTTFSGGPKFTISADDRNQLTEMLRHAPELKPKPTPSSKSKPKANPIPRPQKKTPRGAVTV